jgi:hypothetical protein
MVPFTQLGVEKSLGERRKVNKYPSIVPSSILLAAPSRRMGDQENLKVIKKEKTKKAEKKKKTKNMNSQKRLSP